MNILLLASHAVAEFDDIRMFTDMGHDVFCPGGYQDPRKAAEGIRPGIPNASYHPDLIEACEDQRRKYGDPGEYIDWAKARLHPMVIDWADIIIVHHFVERWIGAQWPQIRHKRVVWRTCGQSDPRLEREMAPFRREGLQIVRYSPAERRFFEPRKHWAGEDALIRFGKYPDDYGPWTGTDRAVGNLTQDLVARGDACGYGYWRQMTAGLPTHPAGKGSETLANGAGILSYDGMLAYLRNLRTYLYTGTRPASYTLGLIEAMLSGVPVVSIDAASWGESWGGTDLFEAHEIAGMSYPSAHRTQLRLRDLLTNDAEAARVSAWTRERAVRIFGIDRIATRWEVFLRGDELEPEPGLSYADSLPAVTA